MIDRLDAALGNAKSLDDFLTNPSLVDAHFEAAREYFGSSCFSRPAYDSILRQLIQIKDAVPGLGERLWEPQNGNDFSFELSIARSVARNIQPEAWALYFENWKNELKKEFQEFYQAEPLPFAEIKTVLKKAQFTSEEFERELCQSTTDPLEQKRRRRAHYKQRRNDPELTRIAALLVYNRIEYNTRSSSLLNSGDGDFILNLVRNWVQYPRTIAHKSISDAVDPILTSMRDRVPKLRSLLGKKDIFPRRLLKNKQSDYYPSNTLKAGRYFFESLPRNLHGIWYGEPNGDCLATLDKSGDPLPARWALLTVKGSQALHIRSETKYFGSLMIVPITCDGETYGLLEFWSSLFLLKGVLQESEFGEVVNILQIVIKNLKAKMPKSWKGYCICPWISFDNWAVMRYLVSDLDFSPSGIIGISDSSLVKDEIASAVASLSDRNIKAKAFAPGLIHAAAETQPANPIILL